LKRDPCVERFHSVGQKTYKHAFAAASSSGPTAFLGIVSQLRRHKFWISQTQRAANRNAKAAVVTAPVEREHG
jgi:hypothetical protein